ncbi:MAG: hypothetical protein K6F00_00400, partial [Lachnospiraceae bacterium]|nr:hypothetical protein [Lachnospiraceae bacterium]
FNPVSDVSQKKVISYYISVSTILEYKDKAINKMNRVLDVFAGISCDVDLLWLCDEYAEAVLENDDKELFEKYLAFKERFLSLYPGGITTDMKKASDYSAAYFGDHLLAANLFLKTGKPVMIQEIDL